MILGVDHIALSGVALEQDGAVLEKIGLVRRFHHHGLENARSKEMLLNDYQPEHDIGVYDPASGVAIEITVHGGRRPVGTHFGFVPVARVGPDLLETASLLPPNTGLIEAVEAGFGAKASLYHLPALETPILIVENTNGDDGPKLLGATHLVPDPITSSAFFQSGLSAQHIASGIAAKRKWELMKFSGPVEKWRMPLLLLEAPEARPLRLDNAGWPALAVLTSDIDADAVRAASAGYAVSFRQGLQVNDRLIEFGMLRGPGGELIELLYFPRKRP